MPAAHCPHCLLAMPGGQTLPYPPAAMRCPNCRLIIGVGRARADAVSEDGDARSRGSAAGVLANAARRAQSEAGDVDEVRAALRTVAEQQGCAVERLRMLDYQEHAERDPELPGLSTVLATFATWKAARAAAAGVLVEALAPGDDAVRVA